MGKATRWLRGLLGMRKGKESVGNSSNCGEKKEKKRWSFVKSGKDSGGRSQIPVHVPTADSERLRSFVDDSEKEQSKHAIAVAAATAAAADAAVAAAQAAVAVVRLTSQGTGSLFSGSRVKWAAIKIQNAFRGFLARKALRALKGLVKLQALVRGYLVRKRAAATLHSMQALVRAQAALRSRRVCHSVNNVHRFRPETGARQTFERLLVSYDPAFNAYESPKIVEMDTCHPKSRSWRMSNCMSEYGDDLHSRVMSSPLPCPIPSRTPIHDYRGLPDYDWGFVEEDYKFATARNTPRFACSDRFSTPMTPAKSVCGDGFFRPYSNFPNYMTDTASFRAKLRSHSAPKQRPERCPKKRSSLNEVMASRTSFSGVRMQRTCSQVQEGFEV